MCACLTPITVDRGEVAVHSSKSYRIHISHNRDGLQGQPDTDPYRKSREQKRKQRRPEEEKGGRDSK